MDIDRGSRTGPGEDKMNKAAKQNGWMKVVAGLVLALGLINCAGSRGLSPRSMDLRLIRAAEAGRTQEVKNLISAGADINATDAQGWTPYLAASSNGQLDAMKILKALGAKTNTYLEERALAIQ